MARDGEKRSTRDGATDGAEDVVKRRVRGLVTRGAQCLLACLCIGLGTTPLFAQIGLTGNATTPASPATLSWGQAFSCAADGALTLRYPDGSVFRFTGPCDGRVVRGGLQIRNGRGALRFVKQKSAFIVTTPAAILGVRGTSFFLEPSPASFAVLLEEGRLEVSSPEQGSRPILMKPGQKVSLDGKTLRLSETAQSERTVWQSRFAMERGVPVKKGRFGELFLFGMTRLIQGTVTVQRPNEAPAVRTAPAVVPVDAVVTTGSDRPARLALECGSVIDLGPDARVAIRPFSLDVQGGEIAIRHVGSPFPLKLSGAVSASLASESVVELHPSGDRYLVRIQAGEGRFGSARETLTAGAGGEITKTGVRAVSDAFSVFDWKSEAIPETNALPSFAPEDEAVEQPAAEPPAVEPLVPNPVAPVPRNNAGEALRRHAAPVTGEEVTGN